MKLALAIVAVAAITLAAANRQEPQHTKHWAYVSGEETVGPADWGSLPGNAVCASGKAQSPVPLADVGASAAKSATTPALAFDYHPAALSLVNNGHTVQATVPPGSSVTEGGVTYKLVQFHFHAPSEHTLDGKRYPLELHLVHVDAAGKPALVVGVFITEGATNAALSPVFASLPQKEGYRIDLAKDSVDASALLPDERTHFDYGGSLTTPPCTEGIRWRVMRAPITMSGAQIDAYRLLPHLGHSARPMQSAHGRSEVLVTSP